MAKELFTTRDTESGEEISVRFLHILGESPEGYLDPEKIKELWTQMSRYDVLFSDQTEGKLQPFLDILFDGKSVWFELFSLDEEKPIGVAMISNIIPFFDANGHFAIWNGRARGKEQTMLKIMEWAFKEYKLHRMTAEITGYQRGVIRFAERLGFKLEGEKREAVIKHGNWIGLVVLGMVESELREALNNGS